MATSTDNQITLYNTLLSLLNSGKYPKAAKLYEKNKKRTINNTDIWKMFAEINSRRQDMHELAYCCKRLLELTTGDAGIHYNYGATLQNLGQSEAALEQYEHCIRLTPANMQAKKNAADLHLTLGHYTDAIALYENLPDNTTIEISASHAQALYESDKVEDALELLQHDIGQVDDVRYIFIKAQCHYKLAEYPQSEMCYKRVLDIDIDNFKAWNNLGRLYDEIGALDESTHHYQKALEIDSSSAVVYHNLGKALAKSEKQDEAREAFLRSLELDPTHPETNFNLGKIYSESQDFETALEYYRRALDCDIQNLTEKPDEFIDTVNYYISTAENPDKFDTKKKEYIANLFDKYADTFEEHLVNKLDYQVPDVIDGALKKYIQTTDNRSIDLGCGTGLCCRSLRDISANIIGVDISPKMIEKSRELGCYDDLFVGDVSEVINSLDSTISLSISADVFIYIGSLLEVFPACSKKMESGGYFIFSTELLNEDEDGEYSQVDSGRFKHKISYIEDMATVNNFSVIEHIPCPIRKEYNEPVPGNVSVLQKK